MLALQNQSQSSPSETFIREFRSCRVCGRELVLALDLGTHAVSDFYATIPADELRAPLRLMQCASCGLVQLSHSVDKERLYRHYWYHSGLNETMVRALREIVDEAMGRVTLEPGDAVLDIGANDGTLLDQYPTYLQTYGFEPSDVAPNQERHTIFRRFYPGDPDGPLSFTRKMKIITSIAMFYDVDDPSAFVANIKANLDDDGIWVCQMMDFRAMLAANAFDNVCHEHTVYWDLSNFAVLCNAHGLSIETTSRNQINGGSVRVVIRHTKPDSRLYVPLPTSDTVQKFGNRVNRLKDETLAFLEECRYNGKQVLGYGASTKGSTLLQYYGITPDLLPAIADRNPDKVGTITAGQHIPVIGEDEMRRAKPDYLFILPWGFLDAFIERERDLRAQGTRFVVPLPDLRVI